MLQLYDEQLTTAAVRCDGGRRNLDCLYQRTYDHDNHYKDDHPILSLVKRRIVTSVTSIVTIKCQRRSTRSRSPLWTREPELQEPERETEMHRLRESDPAC